MWLRRLLVLLLALVAAGGTTFYLRSLIEHEQAPQAAALERPRAVVRQVMVAARDLPVGTILGADDVRWQDWPEELVGEGWILGGDPAADVSGAVVRTPLARGSPVPASALVPPGERGLLAAVLRPGHVALTLPVDDAFAEARLVQPGDHVDVLLAQQVGDPEGGGDSRHAAELLVEDARVLAVGDRIVPASDGRTADAARPFRSATLEFTPEDARRVAVAMELGRILLALRPLARQAPGEIAVPPVTARTSDPVTFEDEASRARRGHRPVLVFRGTQVERLSPAGSASRGFPSGEAVGGPERTDATARETAR